MSAELTGASEIRAALLAAIEPLSVGDIFGACKSITSTTDVASMMHAERAAGRVERTGESGAYRYALTDAGRQFATNPRLLRSRSNRRMNGRGPAPLPTPAVAPAPQPTPTPTPPPPAIAAATEAKPKRPAHDDTADRAARLAAAVLEHWPTPLSTMPAGLRNAVQASIAPILGAA